MKRVTRILGGAALAAILAACGPEPSPVPQAPPAEPAISCLGVPPRTCQEMLDDARRNAEPGTVVVQMRIVCTLPPCTLQAGETEAEVLYSNGQRSTFGMGWSGPMQPQGP